MEAKREEKTTRDLNCMVDDIAWCYGKRGESWNLRILRETDGWLMRCFTPGIVASLYTRCLWGQLIDVIYWGSIIPSHLPRDVCHSILLLSWDHIHPRYTEEWPDRATSRHSIPRLHSLLRIECYLYVLTLLFPVSGYGRLACQVLYRISRIALYLHALTTILKAPTILLSYPMLLKYILVWFLVRNVE